jgi:hypothetical protein
MAGKRITVLVRSCRNGAKKALLDSRWNEVDERDDLSSSVWFPFNKDGRLLPEIGRCVDSIFYLESRP